MRTVYSLIGIRAAESTSTLDSSCNVESHMKNCIHMLCTQKRSHRVLHILCACAGAQLLIVAGMDRLDTELTVGQIQGKFQMRLVYNCGHSVHEDQPAQVAGHIWQFGRHFGVLRDDGTGAAATQAEAELLQRKLERAKLLCRKPP
jgi:hypothetical protein